MATAHGIVIVADKAEKFSITARVVQEGNNLLYLKGRVADTFPQVFGKVIRAVRTIADYMDCPPLDTADINLRIETPNNYPLAGESYGLAAGIAILAAAHSKVIPADNCYTGCLDSDGHIKPVDFIGKKRRGAAGLGFERFFLPRSQIDLFSTYIAQCPCGHLADAYGITFWGEK